MDEQRRAREHLDDLLALESGLTDNELKWVERMDKQWQDNGWFSAKQIKIIYDIYDRRC